MTSHLALIPARGGSKGIPRKNVRNFAGYPLIAWSIAAAKQSELVTRVIVSTDDEEIASVAREFGAGAALLLGGVRGEFHPADGEHLTPDQALPVA